METANANANDSSHVLMTLVDDDEEQEQEEDEDEAPCRNVDDSAPPSENIRGCFYSVFAPSELRPKGFEVSKYIFGDKGAALRLVRETKKARFRQFEYYRDAVSFATHGIIEQPVRGPNSHRTIAISGGNGNGGGSTCHGVGEKMSPFKGPKPQELVKLRKAIEADDYELVRSTIWENPRYLVSSGDTPSILQEGYRYNALHVAAKINRAAIADLILTTISDEKFLGPLYGDDGFDDIDERIETLLDLYLNTPDKGINETPLHFAVKFAAVEVVEVLVSFPQCDKTLKNKHQQTPDMIICDRYTGPDPVAPLRKRISMLLNNEFYVPVLRAEDNSTTPLIGKPFSPGRSQVVSNDVLSPRMEIHAYAGPMNREDAEQFRRNWKTPPRNTSTPTPKTRTNNNRSHSNNNNNKKQKETSTTTLDSVLSLRFTDHLKGLERVGQRLADQYDVTWHEFWPFLNCFTDITSSQGLSLLDGYLGERAICLDRSHGLLDDHYSSIEHLKDASTISDLCRVFQSCNLIDTLEQDGGVDDGGFDPFLCVERACDVFATRLACDMTNKVTLGFKMAALSLEHQIRQMELSIASYKEDARFARVDFRCFHVRLARLVARKVLSDNDDDFLVERFEEFLLDFVKTFDFFSSDDDQVVLSLVARQTTTVKKQAVCVMRAILEQLDGASAGDDGDEKFGVNMAEEEECAKVWAECKTCSCIFDSNNKTRKGGPKSRNPNKYTRSGAGGKDPTVRRLFNPEHDYQHLGELLVSNEKTDSSSSDEEADDNDFYTPPASPIEHPYDEEKEEEEEEEEDFEETRLLPELFIEGEAPSKTDRAVFNALKYSDTRIDLDEHPNVYRWLHAVSLYSESDRSRWPDVQMLGESLNGGDDRKSHRPNPKWPTATTTMTSPPGTPTKFDVSPAKCTRPSRSWLRIIGVNSPKR